MSDVSNLARAALTKPSTAVCLSAGIIGLLLTGAMYGAEPGLKETTDWLRDSLYRSGYTARRVSTQNGSTLSSSMKVTPEVVRFDNCVVAYRTKSEGINRSAGTFNAYSTRTQYLWGVIDMGFASSNVELSEIQVVDTNVFAVAIRKAPGQNMGRYGTRILFTENGSPVRVLEEKEGESGGVMFEFDDQSMAQRVAKAFSHAISLCGGSQDPF